MGRPIADLKATLARDSATPTKVGPAVTPKTAPAKNDQPQRRAMEVRLRKPAGYKAARGR
jgi:hypothetical protein